MNLAILWFLSEIFSIGTNNYRGENLTGIVNYSTMSHIDPIPHIFIQQIDIKYALSCRQNEALLCKTLGSYSSKAEAMQLAVLCMQMH